jgi:hypothetical protein
MTALQTCPKCGGRLALSRKQSRGGLIDRRRDCKCGYADRVLVREEITAIIEVAKKLSSSVRVRTRHRTQKKKPRQN